MKLDLSSFQNILNFFINSSDTDFLFYGPKYSIAKKLAKYWDRPFKQFEANF